MMLTIYLDPPEAEALCGLLDSAVKAEGIKVAKQAAIIFEKLKCANAEAAQDEARKSTDKILDVSSDPGV